MMKRAIRVLLLVFAVASASNASAQKVGIKTNVLYDLTTTVNLGLEIALGHDFTLELPVNYIGWQYGDTTWKHFLVQPELRYWTCSRFNGHFFGIHGHYARFNVGGIKFLDGIDFFKARRDMRYQGQLYGGGISYGYQWYLGPRWNLEATIGVGYARMCYDVIPIVSCGEIIKDATHDYWGVTKVGVTFIYFIK